MNAARTDAADAMDGNTSNAIASVSHALTEARAANLTREVIALEAAHSLLMKVWHREDQADSPAVPSHFPLVATPEGDKGPKPIPTALTVHDRRALGVAEPTITRIDFAPGHENERLTDEGVAGKLRLMKAAPVLRDALNAAMRFMRENCSDAPGYDAVYEQACAAIDQSTGATE